MSFDDKFCKLNKLKEDRKKAIENKDWSEVVDVYQKMIDIDPTSGRYNKCGLLLLKMGRYSESIEKFQKALEIKPNSKDAHDGIQKATTLAGQLNGNETVNESDFSNDCLEKSSVNLESKVYFGRYQLISELGRGGMGKVFKVYDAELRRYVALKVLISGNNEKEKIERFLREARAIANLNHQNIVRAYDIGYEKGEPFFTMDFIEGKSLKEFIQTTEISNVEKIKIMIKIANAVQYAHEKGIIHRDLKPSNIMMQQNIEPKVMDFGLAKVITESKKLSKSGAIIGTFEYMPPEQAASLAKAIDERSDVYSLGAILYEMMTKRPPFQGDSFSLIYQVLEKDPLSPRKINKKIPKDLESICLKALEKKKNRRYSNAKEFSQDLENFNRGEVVKARPVSFSGKLWRKIERRKGTIILLSLFMFMLTIGGSYFVAWVNNFYKNLQMETEETLPEIEKTVILTENNDLETKEKLFLVEDEQPKIKTKTEHTLSENNDLETEKTVILTENNDLETEQIKDVKNNNISEKTKLNEKYIKKGRQERFKFTAKEKAQYVFFTQSDINTYGELYRNEELLNKDDNSGEGGNFKIFQVLSPGEYEIIVNAQDQGGAYTFHIEGPGLRTDSDDHGSSIWSATNIKVGSTVKGKIDTLKDSDYFKFEVEKTGKYVAYTRTLDGSSLNSYGYFLDKDYNSIIKDDDDGEGKNFRLVYELKPGVYYIFVAGEYYSKSFGEYTLHLEGPGAGTKSDDHGSSPWSATKIKIGSTTSGSISQVGDSDYFEFEVEKTGKYVAYTRTLDDSSLNSYGYFLDKDYNSIIKDDDDGEGKNFRLVYELKPGVYYIFVAGEYYSKSFGEYTLHLEGPGAGTKSDDHGFSPWSATKIKIGSTTSGSISQVGDSDYFEFEVEKTGKYVAYTRTLDGSSLNSYGYFLDKDYNSIIKDDDDGEGKNFRLVYELKPGVYYIFVAGEYYSKSFGEYTLHLEGPGAGTKSDDHGSSPWSATKIKIGSTTSGSISQVGDSDYFEFEVEKTGKYVAYTRTLDDSSLNSYGYFLDKDYNSIIKDDDDGEGKNFRLVYELKPGVYYIFVAGEYYSKSFGEYTLHLEGPGAGTKSDDHGFSPWSATKIKIGSATSGSISQVGDSDYFEFEVEKTGKYVAYTRTLDDSSLNSYGYFLNKDYNSIIKDDDDGEGKNFRLVYELKPGVYYISVAGEYGKSFGEYTFHLEGPGAGTKSDDHGFSPWSATKIKAGYSVDGSIDVVGDLDYFKFYIPIEKDYVIYTITSESSSLDSYGTLFDKNYKRIAYDDNDGEGDNFFLKINLKRDIYYILISSQKESTGEYSLHIKTPRK